MSAAFQVDPAQLRRHVATVESVRAQFAAVKGASSAISADSAAYGLLCGWMAGILETRHQKQNSLYAYVEENLAIAAEALTATASEYESTDSAASDRIRQAGGQG